MHEVTFNIKLENTLKSKLITLVNYINCINKQDVAANPDIRRNSKMLKIFENGTSKFYLSNETMNDNNLKLTRLAESTKTGWTYLAIDSPVFIPTILIYKLNEKQTLMQHLTLKSRN